MLRNSLFTIHFSPSSSKSVGSPSFVFQAAVCHGGEGARGGSKAAKPDFSPLAFAKLLEPEPFVAGRLFAVKALTSLPAYLSGPVQGAPSGGLQDHLWAAPCLLEIPPAPPHTPYMDRAPIPKVAQLHPPFKVNSPGTHSGALRPHYELVSRIQEASVRLSPRSWGPWQVPSLAEGSPSRRVPQAKRRLGAPQRLSALLQAWERRRRFGVSCGLQTGGWVKLRDVPLQGLIRGSPRLSPFRVASELQIQGFGLAAVAFAFRAARAALELSFACWPRPQSRSGCSHFLGRFFLFVFLRLRLFGMSPFHASVLEPDFHLRANLFMHLLFVKFICCLGGLE